MKFVIGGKVSANLSDRSVIGVEGGQVRRSPEATGKGARRELETWEGLQARLVHLGYLGEELAEAVTGPAASAWLYRVIAAEAGEVAWIAGTYIAECERPHSSAHGGGAL
jgi:hypothetical protein